MSAAALAARIISQWYKMAQHMPVQRDGSNNCMMPFNKLAWCRAYYTKYIYIFTRRSLMCARMQHNGIIFAKLIVKDERQMIFVELKNVYSWHNMYRMRWKMCCYRKSYHFSCDMQHCNLLCFSPPYSFSFPLCVWALQNCHFIMGYLRKSFRLTYHMHDEH